MQQDNILPESDTAKPREALGLTGLKIADLYAEMVDLQITRIGADKNTQNKIDAAQRGKALEFYRYIRSVFMVAGPYVPSLEEGNFRRFRADIKKINDPRIYSLEYIEEICEFTQKILKETNLGELGKKSRVSEIDNAIDIVI